MKIFPRWRKLGIFDNYIRLLVRALIKIINLYTLIFLIFFILSWLSASFVLSSNMISNMINLISVSRRVMESWAHNPVSWVVRFLVSSQSCVVLARQVYLGLTKLQWSLQSSVLTSTCSPTHISVTSTINTGHRQSDGSNDHLYSAPLTKYWAISSQISEWIHTFSKHKTWR